MEMGWLYIIGMLFGAGLAGSICNRAKDEFTLPMKVATMLIGVLCWPTFLGIVVGSAIIDDDPTNDVVKGDADVQA